MLLQNPAAAELLIEMHLEQLRILTELLLLKGLERFQKELLLMLKRLERFQHLESFRLREQFQMYVPDLLLLPQMKLAFPGCRPYNQ